MSKIKYYSDTLDIQSKTIILRLDLNVPLKDKKIQDFTRITLALPFIKDLIKKKAKIIIISHLGRPKGSKVSELSLIPVYKFLKEQLKSNLFFFMGNIDEEIKSKCSYLKEGEIILLENIRFSKGESENDDMLAKKLASLGDIYINDAFSCSHREQASIHKITKYIQESYAGPLLKKEVEAINLVIKNKKEPVTCIIGGSKISTKINVISNLIKNVNNIVIVGAMANNFLAFKGFKIGKSLLEENSNKIINEIYAKAQQNNCNIIIPEDCNVSTSFEGAGTAKTKDGINNNEIILDIGPKTIKNIENIIDQSNTVLWNGPAGYFENQNFIAGTLAIANKISKNTSNKSLVSILGGGDTIAAINKSNEKFTFTHLSTAGGAFLEFLEGKDLPGLNVLK
ncbi:phosphoglycerate kinase [Pelagibacteraceae bacterium]|jgi:phosphoglycerate kinase|nr:phosphoglycerate kinase [Pelagibacteraceae bacterium]|tara:strand:+ start:1971 stop:3161 length:1191 start_codon:yes stop_codon:yes gene_type:complete